MLSLLENADFRTLWRPNLISHCTHLLMIHAVAWWPISIGGVS
jgi:hypothetical protein